VTKERATRPVGQSVVLRSLKRTVAEDVWRLHVLEDLNLLYFAINLVRSWKEDRGDTVPGGHCVGRTLFRADTVPGGHCSGRTLFRAHEWTCELRLVFQFILLYKLFVYHLYIVNIFLKSQLSVTMAVIISIIIIIFIRTIHYRANCRSILGI